jgi:molybdopterin-containing oxidoreductase family membrane subunit
MHGPYAPLYWALILMNIALPQVLWLRRVRYSPLLLFLVSLDVLIGMWLERFVIVVISLHRDFLPSSWGMYIPTRWDWAIYLGTIGFFVAAMLLFIRVLPMITIFEMRALVHETTEEARIR